MAKTFHVVKIQKKQKTLMAFTIRAINICKINYFLIVSPVVPVPGIGTVLGDGAAF